MPKALHIVGAIISLVLVVGVWRESGPWTGTFALMTLGGLHIAAWYVSKLFQIR